jgi:hypothetical protein
MLTEHLHPPNRSPHHHISPRISKTKSSRKPGKAKLIPLERMDATDEDEKIVGPDKKCERASLLGLPVTIQCCVVEFLARDDKAHYQVVCRACRGVALVLWLPAAVAKFADIQLMMRYREAGISKHCPPLCCVCHNSVLRRRQWGRPGAHSCINCGWLVCAACQCQCTCVGPQCILPKGDDVDTCSCCCAWCHKKCRGVSACERSAAKCARPARTCDDVMHAWASSVDFVRLLLKCLLAPTVNQLTVWVVRVLILAKSASSR